jgi:hypothetical protein
MPYNFQAKERVAAPASFDEDYVAAAPHESSYNAKHRFQGGGEAGMNPAALTAQLRAVPTTWGSLSQDRIVWPDHV